MKFIDIHSHGGRPSDENVLIVNSLRLDEYIAKNYSRELCTVGIYPFDAVVVTDEAFAKLENIAQNENIWAIGETGLDYRPQYRSSEQDQKRVFQRQIEIACKAKKPLVIHQVRALDDLLEMLKRATIPVIFHGFSGSGESAERVVKAGYYLSFGHVLQVNEKLQKTFSQIPVDKIFLETDESPETIEMIYQKAVSLKKISIEELKNQINQNFNNVTTLARENGITVR